ncbi:MAG: 2-oxoacid:acceptor oxidoreductase family protein [Dehalococcoidia bacterium]|nr:2-oxoacid:acceptor oxidoreductase family protein [Dehalococcoidia bacterium]
MADKYEIRLCGYGGQGIILAGFIIGQAATVYEHRHAVFTQDYGPEARGGACRADVIISGDPVLYPYVDTPAVLVAMSQEAYGKYIPRVRKDTLVIYDEDLVKPDLDAKGRMLSMPARKIALAIGRIAVANVVMLGFFTAATKALSTDAVKQSILTAVPKATGKLNMSAFEEGYAAAMKLGAGR